MTLNHLVDCRCLDFYLGVNLIVNVNFSVFFRLFLAVMYLQTHLYFLDFSLLSTETCRHFHHSDGYFIITVFTFVF